VHKLVARSQNALRGRWENLWASERTCVVKLVGREAVMDKLVYTATNPVADHLVERAHQWPGVNGLAALLSGRALRAPRPLHFFRGDGAMPEAVEGWPLCCALVDGDWGAGPCTAGKQTYKSNPRSDAMTSRGRRGHGPCARTPYASCPARSKPPSLGSMGGLEGKAGGSSLVHNTFAPASGLPDPGKRTLTEQLPDVQTKHEGTGGARGEARQADTADAGAVQQMSPGGGAGGAPAVQRTPKADPLAWRNAVIAGENRIQDIVRAAQRDKKGRLELDLVIAPDFVGVERQAASGTAPAGKDPDGIGVHRAAAEAMRDFVADPPRSRRIMTVVLERTAAGWERNRFTMTGETRAADEPATSADSAGGQLQWVLQFAEGARHGEVRLDVMFSPDGVRILSWRSSGSSGPSGAKARSDDAARLVTDLAAMASGRTMVYELRYQLEGGAWETQSFKLIGEVKPPDAKPDGAEQPIPRGGDPDDAEEIVADVKNTRRLILSTAAELIAEQDPTRLDNLIFSIGPLAIVGMVRVGRVVRIGRKWKARAIADAACEVGCENVARQIQRHVGGDIVRITPRNAPALGGFRGKSWNWVHHEVVVRDGRVYDLTTGHHGLPIAEYKALWQYPDSINFGF
jgi:hypothetical protein